MFKRKTLQSFDYISDLHVSYHVNQFSPNRDKRYNTLEEFVQSILPPKSLRSPILVIGGDLGHYNEQNIVMLELLSRHYDTILFIFGNHDYHMISEGMVTQFNANSMNRIKDLKQRLQLLVVQQRKLYPANVYHLDGDIFPYKGVKFGGATGWYDLLYYQHTYGWTPEQAQAFYDQNSNDPANIYNPPKADEELAKVANLVKAKPDVVFTHLAPTWEILPTSSDPLDDANGLIAFDGRELVKAMRGKIWCYGHTHIPQDTVHNGCRLINNAYGKPHEALNRGIKTISLQEVKHVNSQAL